jgi:hypothetical protein
MSEKQIKFLVELGELFNKYGVKVDDYDNYDESKNYIGTDYALNGDGISVSAGNLMEAIARANNAFTRYGRA